MSSRKCSHKCVEKVGTTSVSFLKEEQQVTIDLLQHTRCLECGAFFSDPIRLSENQLKFLEYRWRADKKAADRG